jgi:nucleoside-diphosphate-sugar epimerase
MYGGEKRMRILLTGSSGFIGSHLLPKLVNAGHEVTALHRYVTGRYVLGENVKTVFACLRDNEGIRNAVKEADPETCIHLAAISPVSYSYEHPQEVTLTNYLGLINLAEACRTQTTDFKHFITAGTSEEYGNQPVTPIKEDAKLYPNSPYAVAKASSTKYLEYMRDGYEFPMTVCRPFNTYGRVRNRHFVMERILTQMMRGQQEIRLGDPEPVRDMMFREDHVSSYLSVLGNSDSIGETFNFCTGKGYSIAELVSYCKEATGWDGKVTWGTIPKRPLDIDVLIGDNEKAAQRLGWQPRYTLKAGIEHTLMGLEKSILPPNL